MVLWFELLWFYGLSFYVCAKFPGGSDNGSPPRINWDVVGMCVVLLLVQRGINNYAIAICLIVCHRQWYGTNLQAPMRAYLLHAVAQTVGLFRLFVQRVAAAGRQEAPIWAPAAAPAPAAQQPAKVLQSQSRVGSGALRVLGDDQHDGDTRELRPAGPTRSHSVPRRPTR